jgi:hypothetical protein
MDSPPLPLTQPREPMDAPKRPVRRRLDFDDVEDRFVCAHFMCVYMEDGVIMHEKHRRFLKVVHGNDNTVDEIEMYTNSVIHRNVLERVRNTKNYCIRVREELLVIVSI